MVSDSVRPLAREAQVMPIVSDHDVVLVRRAARELAEEIGIGLVARTKLVTACSELARNVLEHAGGGRASLAVVSPDGARRHGVEVVFADDGPGIGDVERAFERGYSTKRGLGLGLGGSRRLVDDFALSTEPGEGTTILIRTWA